MKRIAWLTDIHLNFLLDHQVDQFLLSVAELRSDAVLVGGDIAEALDVCNYLERMVEAIPAPIYFVLGNHDYYHGSIAQVRHEATELCRLRPRLHYLTAMDVAPLSKHVGLVGHDGWADGRAGDFGRSMVSMQDYKLIAELSGLKKQSRWEKLNALGNEAAAHIQRVLPLALEQFREVILLKHVPPLRDACWYEGRISDDQWAPHFTCQAVGETILEIMATHREKQLTVFCGHTHGSGETHPLPNVTIITGGAEYGHPAIQRVLEID